MTRRTRLILVAALATLALPGAAQAATITVATGGDSGGVTDCTLRQAVDSADTNTSVGACTAGSGDDVVMIPASVGPTIQLSLNRITAGATGFGTLAIQGPGAGMLDVQGPPDPNFDRVFAVTGTPAVTISGLTISHGNRQFGGAVFVESGADLTLDHVVVTGNHSQLTLASGDVDMHGGAIYSAGALTIRDSSVSDNVVSATVSSGVSGDQASATGGGVIQTTSRPLLIERSTISGNTTTASSTGTGTTALAVGGGIEGEASAPVTVRESTVSANTASASLTSGGTGDFASANGGGIYQNGTLLTAEESTVSGNTATASATGTGVTSDASGGGIAIPGATFRNGVITKSTISGNQAIAGDSDSGGGVTINGSGGGGGLLEGDTITGNRASSAANGHLESMTVRNTLVSNPLGGPNCVVFVLTSGGFNLEDANTCGFGQPTDQINVASTGLDPALADNGGPTLTHALLPGSPAIDRGSAFGETTDQRGLARPVDFPGLANASGGDGTDIGAFEFQSTCAGQPTPGASCTPSPPNGPTGQQAAAIKKCKKKFPGKAKAKKRKKCIKRAKQLPE